MKQLSHLSQIGFAIERHIKVHFNGAWINDTKLLVILSFINF